MTYRRVISYGLIAGLRYPDMQDMYPGEILDYFVYYRDYDDQRMGIPKGVI